MKIHFGHYKKVMFVLYFLTDLCGFVSAAFQEIESFTFCWKFCALDLSTTYCLGIALETVL